MIQHLLSKNYKLIDRAELLNKYNWAKVFGEKSGREIILSI